MADVLPRLLSFPRRSDTTHAVSDEEYDEQARNFVAYLKECLPNKTDEVSGGILEQLDPSVHSLSFLLVFHFHVLALRSRTNQVIPKDLYPGNNLWSKALLFLKTFDPIQVRYAGYEWRKVVESVARAAEAVAKKPLLAIRPIRDAMLRLDPSGSSFTSNHVLLSRLCLRARAYALALPVIDKDICVFPASADQAYLRRSQPVMCAQHESSATFITNTSGFSSKLTYRDHLQYFLYSSMIYMGLKQWDRALHFLSIVISSPSINSVSAIMVEAYKKWVLPIPIPTITPPHAVKLYRSLARPYDALADAFRTGNFDKLKAEAEIGQSIWHMASSYLLQAFESFIFTFLSLLYASNSTMLRFSSLLPSSDAVLEKSIRQRLLVEQQKLRVLANNVQSSDMRLELGKEYVDYLRKSQKRNDSTSKDGLGKAGGRDLDFDEDMMSDLR
ncbi:COP9 subunit 3 [Rasamsonia emersonii CBS 393.64]|uniref:COP9 subunit 3 n=1 Tax=Rasamsonia emersonii (strain ATCC 16479 / CBS 393.64 / IMI 116815) TaxID=1408163 RepID=A0A0F4YQK2_RASE3|nr:COP9 subunit 3 [Rasamsonia emersonii CBS 393.64]KKA20529.1 COP9 subunit 3 [Rasamsonia emersonii CBS 393.64]